MSPEGFRLHIITTAKLLLSTEQTQAEETDIISADFSEECNLVISLEAAV